MPEIALVGCRPEPLISYLKALGVSRLVAAQKDPNARGAWRTESFRLNSTLNEEGLVAFFQCEYRPTPIVGPWAGNSGFFAKDNKEAVEAILASTTPRLQDYQTTIQTVCAILDSQGLTEKPSGPIKNQLLRLYRRSLPDSAVLWMDAALVLTELGQTYPPVLGTGGNDGHMDFTMNFMQRLMDIGLTGREAPFSTAWLRNSLFGTPMAGLLSRAVGQFEPGRASGPNSGQGMSGDSGINPWDYVLMLEGSLLLAGAATRRYGAQSRRGAAFPFTVNATPAGEGAASSSELVTARGEIWLPLWEAWTSSSEISFVFSEGRASLGRRQARDGTGFARAIASLGMDRGLSEFTRFGFLQRSGLAYLAAPLGRFKVHSDPSVDILREVDAWLSAYRAAAVPARPTARSTGGLRVPPRFTAALRRLDSAILNHVRYGGPARAAEMLCALGGAERELSRAIDKLGQVGNRILRPLPPLSPAWRETADDGSVEYRLAAALASISDISASAPIRANLEPVLIRNRQAVWTTNGQRTGRGGLLPGLVAELLERRLLDHGPEGLEATVSLEATDITAFLRGDVNDTRIMDLLWGLMLVAPNNGDTMVSGRLSGAPIPGVPRSYALIKLIFLPPSRALRDTTGASVKPDAAVLGRLRAQDLQGACLLAARKLRAAGFMPLPGPTASGQERFPESIADLNLTRLRAALLLPIRSVAHLRKLVIREAKQKTAPTPIRSATKGVTKCST